MSTSRKLFDQVSIQASRTTTRAYSTSFSFGIRLLDRSQRDPIYSIYGFVRFADEIVDTFHENDKRDLLRRFREDTFRAIDDRISLNPILNSFQATVREFGIGRDVIDTFLRSMEMDLDKKEYTRDSYEDYILGSAEVVGLMCLSIFCQGSQDLYKQLTPYAMRLGAAFQKVNFLRDLSSDQQELGRTYFPDIPGGVLTREGKLQIENEIHEDFREAMKGIRMLPRESRLGVHIAYLYYYKLFRKICRTSGENLMRERVRIPNSRKVTLMFNTWLKHSLRLI